MERVPPLDIDVALIKNYFENTSHSTVLL